MLDQEKGQKSAIQGPSPPNLGTYPVDASIFFLQLFCVKQAGHSPEIWRALQNKGRRNVN